MLEARFLHLSQIMPCVALAWYAVDDNHASEPGSQWVLFAGESSVSGISAPCASFLVNFSWLVVCHAADVAIRGDLVSLLEIV
ncbi:hypothetical protein RAC83_001828 [Xylella fastidiosa]|nr:hypothetical protein [Xylella fastidiosa]